MALGIGEIGIIAGTLVFFAGTPTLVKWAKALRQSKDEFAKPQKV
ncbi:MAG: hypothetical protein U9R64_15030 [Pseudomonadota bacterium]|nr:hypothetical protein [Pseudomonadota bacterium]